MPGARAPSLDEDTPRRTAAFGRPGAAAAARGDEDGGAIACRSAIDGCAGGRNQPSGGSELPEGGETLRKKNTTRRSWTNRRVP